MVIAVPDLLFQLIKVGWPEDEDDEDPAVKIIEVSDCLCLLLQHVHIS